MSEFYWKICGFCGRDLNFPDEDCPHKDDVGLFHLIIAGTGVDSYNREMEQIKEAKSKSKHPECWEPKVHRNKYEEVIKII
jgi:hypothetical protein